MSSTDDSPATTWLLKVNNAFERLLQGRLQNLEALVTDSLEWLKTRRAEQLKTSTTIHNAPPPSSIIKKKRRGRQRKSGGISKLTSSRPTSPINTTISDEAQIVEDATTLAQQFNFTNRKVQIEKENVPNLNSAVSIFTAEALMKLAQPPTDTKLKRERPKKSDIFTTTTNNVPMTPVAAKQVVMPNNESTITRTATKTVSKHSTVMPSEPAPIPMPTTIKKRQGRVRKLSSTKASVVAEKSLETPTAADKNVAVSKTPKLVESTIIGDTPFKTPVTKGNRMVDLSSTTAASPLLTEQVTNNPTTIMVADVSKVVDSEVEKDTKIEAWTSRFMKNAPADLSSNSKKSRPAINLSAQPIVEIAPLTDKLRKSSLKSFSPVRQTLDTLAVSPTLVEPALHSLLPPPSVTRRNKHKTQNLDLNNPDSTTTTTTTNRPVDYTESPLTKAKRVDAQNIWREMQLKNFLTTKADSVKSALGGLRLVVPAIEQNSSNTLSPSQTEATTTTTAATATVTATTIDDKQEQSSKSHTVLKDIFNETLIKKETLPLLEPVAMAIVEETICPISEDILNNIEKEQPPVSSASLSVFDFESIPSITNSAITSSTLFSTNSSKPLPSKRGIMEKESGISSASFTVTANESPTESYTTGTLLLDPIEIERRKRLKERNEKAVEKKKQLLQKAQQIRSNTIANLSGKPKDLPGRKLTGTNTSSTLAASINTTNNSVIAAHSKLSTSNGSNPLATSSSSSSSTSTSSSLSLQKQAMVNSAIKNASLSTPPRMQNTTIEGGQPTSQFKLPLPKVKSPRSNDHPSSDDTFNIPVKQKPIPENNLLASPRLPQIPSDSSEDEIATSRTNESKENRPIWANTPEVTKSLHQQRSIKPEDIFGEVQPVKLEDFFKDSGRKYARGRTSSVWHP